MQLEFTEQQLNIVVNAIIERPYKEVAEVMEAIRQQLTLQHQKQNASVTDIRDVKAS